jgi:hypothetical protein
MKAPALLGLLALHQSVSAWNANPNTKPPCPSPLVDGSLKSERIGFVAAAFVASSVVFSQFPQAASAFEGYDESDYLPVPLEKVVPAPVPAEPAPEVEIKEELPIPLESFESSLDISKAERALEEAEFRLGELSKDQIKWLRVH